MARVDERINTLGEGVPNTLGKGIPVIVYNPLGWKRSGEVTVKLQLSEPSSHGVLVEDAAGLMVGRETVSADPKTGVTEARIFVKDVPALGYKVLYVMPEVADTLNTVPVQAADKAGELSLEYGGLRVAVNKETGCITSLKRDGVEALASGAGGNQFQFFKDTPKEYDAWNVDPGTLDVAPSTIAKVDATEVVKSENGSASIRVTSHWQNSKFVQTISLPENSDIVDVENDIDWHEAHVLLKASFPVAATSEFATYEIP